MAEDAKFIISYGIDLRGDDGLGAARSLAVHYCGSTGVRVIAAHQPGLEMAPPVVADANGVPFLEAAQQVLPKQLNSPP